MILIVAGMISLGWKLCEKVEISSAEHTAYARELAGGGAFPAESILRGRWYIK